jgi:hypothetical protein
MLVSSHEMNDGPLTVIEIKYKAVSNARYRKTMFIDSDACACATGSLSDIQVEFDMQKYEFSYVHKLVFTFLNHFPPGSPASN